MSRRVWMPLPDRDFDVTEVAVPWKLMTEAGYDVVIATEDGAMPAADPRVIEGVVFGRLGAKPEPLAFYEELTRDPSFRSPRAWRDIDPDSFGGLWLAGGHASGMRQYLDSTLLHEQVAAFWALERPVAAICHGVLCLARAKGTATGASVLHGHRTTCLPKYMERTAYLLTFWKLGKYYRTYPAYVEEEVRAALADTGDFVRGPRTLTAHGTRDDDRPAFVVEDGRYVSGRWPGDSYLVAKRFIDRLDEASAAIESGDV